MKQLSLRSTVLVVVIGLLAVPTFAQKYELNPYAGGAFLGDFKASSDQVGKFSFPNTGVFGVKGGVFATNNFQLEGNFSYLNELRFQNTIDASIHGFRYEGLGTYNFRKIGRVYPYLSAGAGAMTLHVSNPNNPADTQSATFPIIVAPFVDNSPIPFTSRTLTVENRDTFLSIAYGGGVKAERLWGAMGLRFDLRGMTMPNFYGNTVNSWEPSGGILLSWGER